MERRGHTPLIHKGNARRVLNRRLRGKGVHELLEGLRVWLAAWEKGRRGEIKEVGGLL
jgi:hypothetical protein